MATVAVTVLPSSPNETPFELLNVNALRFAEEVPALNFILEIVTALESIAVVR